jgi:hypothetical protein
MSDEQPDLPYDVKQWRLDEKKKSAEQVAPSTTRYTVRFPRREEMRYLVSIGRRLHDNSKFRFMEYDEDRVMILGYTALDNPGHMFLMIIEDTEAEVPVGMLLAGLQQSYFGKDYVANDLLLLVEEEHRGRCMSALRRITALYREWAVERGARRVYLSTSTGVDPERTRVALEACGFHQIGTIHEA